jgi:putative membrane protein
MEQGGDPAAAMQDKAFLKKALEGSMAEVQLAQLALTKTSSEQIKQFAQRMITDHTKLLDVTKSVAQQNGVAIPSGPSKKEMASMAKLRGLTGADFDKAYVKDMLKDHKDDDNDFKMEAQNAQIPNVKMLASRGEPVIASHLQMIEQISKSMNGGSGM